MHSGGGHFGLSPLGTVFPRVYREKVGNAQYLVCESCACATVMALLELCTVLEIQNNFVQDLAKPCPLSSFLQISFDVVNRICQNSPLLT